MVSSRWFEKFDQTAKSHKKQRISKYRFKMLIAHIHGSNTRKKIIPRPKNRKKYKAEKRNYIHKHATKPTH